MYRKIEGFTIDGESSQDLDDAIFLKRENEELTLFVSIADVASKVPLGSGVDRKAYEQGSTKYFRESNTPMLTRELADVKASLLPEQERSVITVEISLNKDFAVQATNIYKGMLCSQKKFSYEEVDSILSDSGSPFHEQFMDLRALALSLLKQRQSNGALAIYDLEHGLITDEEGHLRDLPTFLRHQAHIIVQEIMILTNISVAKFLIEHQSIALFRNHVATIYTPDRSAILTDLAQAITYNPARIKPIKERLFATLGRATYGPQLCGHYALNIAQYLHFTSPIRRYADIVNHRIISALLDNVACPYTIEQLEQIGEHLNELAEKEKNNKIQHFSRLYSFQTHRTAKYEGFEALSDKQFYSLLNTFSEKEVISSEMEIAIINRLNVNRLKAREICCIVIKAPAVPGWAEAKTAALEWLTKNPGEAKATLMIGIQAGLITMTGDIVPTSTEIPTTFTAKIILSKKQETFEGLAIAANKREAEQLACIEAIRRANNLPAESLPEPAPIVQPILPADPNTNYKGGLLELCQKHSLPLPEFTNKQTGVDHALSFECTVKIQIEDTEYVKQGTGKKIKQAENAAARELLPDIEVAINLLNKRPAFLASHNNGNPIGDLAETCVKYSLSEPRYEYTELKNNQGFTVTCVVTYFDASEIKHFDKNSKKQIAKKLAARKTLRELNERLTEYQA